MKVVVYVYSIVPQPPKCPYVVTINVFTMSTVYPT